MRTWGAYIAPLTLWQLSAFLNGDLHGRAHIPTSVTSMFVRCCGGCWAPGMPPTRDLVERHPLSDIHTNAPSAAALLAGVRSKTSEGSGRTGESLSILLPKGLSVLLATRQTVTRNTAKADIIKDLCRSACRPGDRSRQAWGCVG